MALHTGAAVLPAFTIWDKTWGNIRFALIQLCNSPDTGDAERDAITNTHAFHLAGDYARRYPEQWLWVHRRWKTRPPRRAISLLASSNLERRTAESRATQGESSTASSSPNACAEAPSGLSFSKEFGKVSNKSHDCHDHGTGETNKEYCLEKKYKQIHMIASR